MEVTGKTVEEATEAALDQLGVAKGDAELVVLSEPKTGLFGRVRGEARVRARVRPVGPRPKRERRNGRRGAGSTRGRSGRAPGAGSRDGGDEGGEPRPEPDTARRREPRDGGRRSGLHAGGKEPALAGRTSALSEVEDVGTGERTEGTLPSGSATTGLGEEGQGGRGQSRSARRRRSRAKARAARPTAPADSAVGSTVGSTVESAQAPEGREPNGRHGGVNSETTQAKEEKGMAEGMTLEEQAEVGREFLQGLMERMGLEGSVETRMLDDETVELAATGEKLGLLVGPKGATLAALQDLTRTVVQSRFSTRTDRILVDVAGYRQMRVAALQRFARQIGAEVREEGSERALEPMSPADRKVVHDTVNEMDGLSTRSEGEDDYRHVVIVPG